MRFAIYKFRTLFLLLLLLSFSLVGLIAVNNTYAQGNPAPQVESHIPVCPGPSAPGTTRCHSRVVTDQSSLPKTTSQPAGYGPIQFRGGYNLLNASSSATIAIVDAYDHPKIKSDLDTYNSTFGLPPFLNCSATITTSCFQKVNQRGTTIYPKTDAGWALEIALDVEVAHAVCPTCKLLLVEADSNSYANLMAAVDQAVAMGANVISNSYGSSEFSGETSFDSHLNIPGVAITFSSGDSGYGTNYPAASRYATAVGGTTLNLNPDNTYKSESAWSGAGSGCSSFEVQPSWQTSLNLSGCTNRMIADVSADANPTTGAAVYDSVRYQGKNGWFKVGGTSLAAPIVAAVYALSGNTAGYANSIPYANAANLHDIISGSNGSCGNSYLCTAATGYDGPTGLGSPNGVAAF